MDFGCLLECCQYFACILNVLCLLDFPGLILQGFPYRIILELAYKLFPFSMPYRFQKHKAHLGEVMGSAVNYVVTPTSVLGWSLARTISGSLSLLAQLRLSLAQLSPSLFYIIFDLKYEVEIFDGIMKVFSEAKYKSGLPYFGKNQIWNLRLEFII